MMRERAVPFGVFSFAIGALEIAGQFPSAHRALFPPVRDDFSLWKNCESREESTRLIRIIFSCCSRRI
jgi:hypothetical protein